MATRGESSTWFPCGYIVKQQRLPYEVLSFFRIWENDPKTNISKNFDAAELEFLTNFTFDEHHRKLRVLLKIITSMQGPNLAC